tara:strand:- start:324 stop:488 length:165 start_codon:yes stop_codon:yes gene_type:complete
MAKLVEKREKKPSKKEVIADIEKLDTNNIFDIQSLLRTKVDNLIGIRDILRNQS